MGTAMGMRIEQIRRELGLSRRQFGSRIHLSESAVMHIERSDKANPSPTIIETICNVYGINKEWLFTGTGEKYTVHPLIEDELKDRLKKVRGNRTQKEFAEMIGCTVDHIRSIETGRRKASDSFLETVSSKCDVSFEWLRSGAESPDEDNLRRIERYIRGSKKAQEALLEIIKMDEIVWDDIVSVILRKRNEKDVESS